jgi:hypothetical protein
VKICHEGKLRIEEVWLDTALVPVRRLLSHLRRLVLADDVFISYARDYSRSRKQEQPFSLRGGRATPVVVARGAGNCLSRSP